MTMQVGMLGTDGHHRGRSEVEGELMADTKVQSLMKPSAVHCSEPTPL